MNLYEETQMLLRQYNLRAKKKFGQNFLINREIIEQIISKSEISKDDVVLEIGPGLGTLTKELLKSAKKVIAVELDEDMVSILHNRFNDPNLEIINEDILKLDLHDITSKYGRIKVVANLPYYITTPIIMKLLEDNVDISSITVMVQKEVGERLCGSLKDKNNGAITFSIKYYADSKIIISVPKDNFLPVPEVDSVVIKLELLDKPRVEVKDKEVFFGIIKSAFSQRRKTINNSLASGIYTKEQIINCLNNLGINPMLRAENLSIQDYADISNYLENN